MELVLPLQFDANGEEYKEIDKLNIDTWKEELKTHDINHPKNILNGLENKFDFASFMNQKVLILKKDFTLYLGSSTTPPCESKFCYKSNNL